MCCAKSLCKHCYFDIKALKNEDGSKIACPGCRTSFWYALPNDYFFKMVKTLKMEFPRYHCNSPIQNGDLMAHLNSCVNLISPTKDELGGYLNDFLDSREFIKTFKFYEGLLYSMKAYTEEKDWDYSYSFYFLDLSENS